MIVSTSNCNNSCFVRENEKSYRIRDLYSHNIYSDTTQWHSIDELMQTFSKIIYASKYVYNENFCGASILIN